MLNRLTIHAVNLVATALIVAAALFLLHANAKHQYLGYWHMIFVVALVSALLASLFNYWRLLKVSEAPISSIASAAQGYVELHGVASTVKPIKTPYQGVDCVWYKAWVYAHEPHQRKVPVLLDYAESHTPFLLKDDSGECLVNPKGAEILHVVKKTFFKNNHRYVEAYLPSRSHLHVIGYLDTRHRYGTAEAIQKDVSALLHLWKANKPKLLNQYDQNLDGAIDMQEWTQARNDAHAQVLTQHQMQANVGVYTLSQPDDGKLFLISALSPQGLRSLLKWWHYMHIILAVLLFALYLALVNVNHLKLSL
jgi:hypothetical protein